MSHASGSPVFQNSSQFPNGFTLHIPFLPFRVRGDVWGYVWKILQKDASIFLSGLQPAKASLWEGGGIANGDDGGSRQKLATR